MNEPTTLGPCAEREFDLVDLADDTLAPEPRRELERHLGGCARCRNWLAEYATLDARLAVELPRPALSSGFDRELTARIGTLQRRPASADLRRSVDREYAQMLERLRRGFGLRTAGHALATAVVTGCLIYLLQTWLPGWTGALPGLERTVSLGLVGGTVSVAALLWAVRRGFGPFQS